MSATPRILITSALLAAFAVPAWADAMASDPGRTEYMSACAACHGVDGKGAGPVARGLTKKPSDLTTLARRSGGVLPVQLVWEVIDGRSGIEVYAHGTHEMPVWGYEYRADAKASPDPMIAARPEWYVRGRIVALIDYLQRIQVK